MIPDDGIESDDEFSHGGGDGDFRALSLFDESFVESADAGIAANGGQGCHVEDGSDLSPTAEDGSLSPEGAAVAAERGETDERGDPAPCQLSEFGHLGQQGLAGDGADTGA